MGILDEFKKLSEESNSSIVADKVLEEMNRQKQLIDEYDEKGTINGVVPEIKQSSMNDEFPEGIDPKMERDASMDEYPDGDVIDKGETPEDLMMANFKERYKKYHEEDLTIIRSKDYEPVIVKAYCPKCGKEIISTAPVMFNPYTMDKICRYDCECGWNANLDYAYPRLVMVNKNTGEELEVYAK